MTSTNRRLHRIAAETLEIVQAGGYRPVFRRLGGHRRVSCSSRGGYSYAPTRRTAGGGFLTGARAQEEDIARASALYACLTTVPEFYAHHRREPDLRYSDRVIYGPDVPVFRDDSGALLNQPYSLSMITAAAPNLSAILTNQPDLAGTVPAVVRARCERVLEVAAAHGCRRLVLGAWGCGVFGNDPSVVATALVEAPRRVERFEHVAFAVLDRSPSAATYGAFVDAILPAFPR